MKAINKNHATKHQESMGSTDLFHEVLGRQWFPYLFFVIALFFIHYNYIPFLGFYADDYVSIRMCEGKLPGISELLQRPRFIGQILWHLSSKLSCMLGGREAFYLFGFAIQTLIVFFVYAAVRRITTKRIAVITSLLVILFPGDGAYPMIVRTQAGAYLAAVFFAAFMFFYVKGMRLYSMLFLAATVFIYELFLIPSLFLPFLVTPLKSKKDFFNQLKATASLGLMIVGLCLFRMLVLPGRLRQIEGFSYEIIAHRILAAMETGLLTSLKTFYLRIAHALRGLTLLDSCYMLVLTCVFFGLLFTLYKKEYGGEKAYERQGVSYLVQLLFVLLIMWIFSYALFITPWRFPPDKLFDRTSEVHIGACIFSSFVFALLIDFAFRIFSKRAYWLHCIASFLVAFAFSSYALFHIHMSLAMAASCEKQKSLQRQIVSLTPDASGDSLIILEGVHPNRFNPFVKVLAWEGTFVYGLIHKFANGYPCIMPLRLLNDSSFSSIDGDKIRVEMNRRFLAARGEYDVENVIWLSCDGDMNLRREFGEIHIQDQNLSIGKKPETILLYRTRGPLFLHVLNKKSDSQTSPWKNSKQNSILYDRQTKDIVLGSGATDLMSSGTTNSTYVTIRDYTARRLSGKMVRVTVVAEKAKEKPSPMFAVAYSTDETGNSGWHKFELTSRFNEYSFIYHVPQCGIGNEDYIGIWADPAGRGRKVAVRALYIEILSHVSSDKNLL